MSFWLGPIIADSEKSIQTFGGYGMPSFMIRNHLEQCLTSNNYKIGTRVGLSMGGNNYKYTYPWLRINQWAVTIINTPSLISGFVCGKSFSY